MKLLKNKDYKALIDSKKQAEAGRQVSDSSRSCEESCHARHFR